jgi:hypothetical protein
MSLSRHATAPGDSLIERGNFPARSKRQIVVPLIRSRSAVHVVLSRR